ncbi:hypothetical protein AAG906_023603 [Vitis piasezkii]
MEHAKKRRVDEGNPTWPEAKSFVSITGHGVKAIVCCKEIIVGNENLRLDQNFAVPSEDMLAETEVMVQTGVLISIDEKLAGVLAISDLLKLGARDVRSIHRPMKVKSITVIEMAKN